MKDRPFIFIGSSTEGLQCAKAIQQNLEHEAESIIWHQGVFGLGDGTLQSLLNLVEEIDFAVLVVTPDDVVVSREYESAAPRDNVLLELGIFLGSLGSNRTFMVVDRSVELKIPSDLAGINPATFVPPWKGNWRSALGTASTEIETAVKSLGKRREHRHLKLSASTFFDVDGAGLGITITNNTGASIPPYDVVMYHPNLGNWKVFRSDSSGELLDGQHRKHRCILPSYCRSEEYEINNLHSPFRAVIEAIKSNPLLNHFEDKLASESNDISEFIFRLQLVSSDRILFESSRVGSAFARCVRASKSDDSDSGKSFSELTDACSSPLYRVVQA